MERVFGRIRSWLMGRKVSLCTLAIFFSRQWKRGCNLECLKCLDQQVVQVQNFGYFLRLNQILGFVQSYESLLSWSRLCQI